MNKNIWWRRIRTKSTYCLLRWLQNPIWLSPIATFVPRTTWFLHWQKRLVTMMITMMTSHLAANNHHKFSTDFYFPHLFYRAVHDLAQLVGIDFSLFSLIYLFLSPNINVVLLALALLNYLLFLFQIARDTDTRAPDSFFLHSVWIFFLVLMFRLNRCISFWLYLYHNTIQLHRSLKIMLGCAFVREPMIIIIPIECILTSNYEQMLLHFFTPSANIIICFYIQIAHCRHSRMMIFRSLIQKYLGTLNVSEFFTPTI